jgi:phosphohistidine phosphatase
MELLLVRHAIAAERNVWRWPNDADRPLTPHGVQRAKRAAAGLAGLVPRPVQLLTSPLQRARATADILSEVAGWPRPTVNSLLSPGVEASKVLAFLGRLRARRIAIVGHEPELGKLIAACLPGKATGAAFRLRKMGVARVVFRSAARAQCGELAALLLPKALRAARPKKTKTVARRRRSVRA